MLDQATKQQLINVLFQEQPSLAGAAMSATLASGGRLPGKPFDSTVFNLFEVLASKLGAEAFTEAELTKILMTLSDQVAIHSIVSISHTTQVGFAVAGIIPDEELRALLQTYVVHVLKGEIEAHTELRERLSEKYKDKLEQGVKPSKTSWLGGLRKSMGW